jgi:hypothetical protein
VANVTHSNPPGAWLARKAALGAFLGLVACSADHRAALKDAGVVMASDAAIQGSEASSPKSDASTAGASCDQDSECTLVASSCCACGATALTLEPVAFADEARELAACAAFDCGECPPIKRSPFEPWLAPACVEGQCVARDLRSDDATRCTRDDECVLSWPQQACCGRCSSDPGAWRALRSGASVHLAGHGCTGDVACTPCPQALQPTAFCAEDGHCAVRATPANDGVPDPTCFAPGARASIALQPNALGCDCFESEQEPCDPVAGSLLCPGGHWQVGFDGPCWIH